MTSHQQRINRLISANNHATLATIAFDKTYSPYQSRVEYAQSQDGSLIFLLSDSANHAKNIKNSRKASLMIGANQTGQVVNHSYVSLQVELSSVDTNSEYVKRYYSYYPGAQELVNELSFQFYRATVSQLYWFNSEDEVLEYSNEIITPLPFSYEEEQNMIKHMNTDHNKAIQHYCDKVSITYDVNDLPVLAGISAYGFHVRTNKQLYWFVFELICENVNCVRKALVKMAQS
jgi:putative heme iron utilization protein